MSYRKKNSFVKFDKKKSLYITLEAHKTFIEIDIYIYDNLHCQFFIIIIYILEN